MAGDLLGVTATNALELGIDIGSLDCAISVGFPGTVSSLRQQWGRAGRRSPGLAVLVASEDALDQYFMREPETLLARTVEAAILDHANPRVLDGHVLSAAFEGPIDDADAQTLGPEALVRAAVLPELKLTDAGWVWAGKDYPAARVLLRSGELDAFTIVDAETGAVLGTVESSRAFGTIHDGAVYLHLGEQYLVRRLDVDARAALVSPATVDWYTQAKVETETTIVEPLRTEARLGLELTFGRVVGDASAWSPTSASRSAAATRSRPSPSTCPRRASRPRRSGSRRHRRSSRISRRCRSSSPRSTRPSTR